jgi:hypothetical protein
VIVAGALGAIVGDSTLFWIARRNAHRVRPQLERAQSNPRVATALAFMGANSKILLTLGRYVPGLRFVVNTTMYGSRLSPGGFRALTGRVRATAIRVITEVGQNVQAHRRLRAPPARRNPLSARCIRYWRAIATRSRSSGLMRWSASSASSPTSICTQLTVPVKTLPSPS